MDDNESTRASRRTKRLAGAVGLLLAGGIAGGALAATSSASAADSTTSTAAAAAAAVPGGTPSVGRFGNAAGGCMLADQALVALRNGDGASRTALARYFAENIAVQASGLERSVVEGADSINNAQAALGA